MFGIAYGSMFQMVEAVTRRSSVQKDFLEILPQSSACNFNKNETLAHLFPCEICEISKNTISYRTPPVADSQMGLQYS